MAKKPIFFEPDGLDVELRGDHVFLKFAGGEIMLTPHHAKHLSLRAEAACAQWWTRPAVAANVVTFPKKRKKGARA